VRVTLLGAGALGREFYEWIRCNPVVEVRFADDVLKGSRIITSDGPTTVLDPAEIPATELMLVTIADPVKRAAAVAARPTQSWATSTTSPSVHAFDSRWDDGTMQAPFTLVSVNAKIGKHCIIGAYSSVGHDVVIGDFCTLSSHVDLCGRVKLGQRVFLGSGARVLPGVAVADDCYIGAGSVVVVDAMVRGTYFGVPARRM